MNNAINDIYHENCIDNIFYAYEVADDDNVEVNADICNAKIK